MIMLGKIIKIKIFYVNKKIIVSIILLAIEEKEEIRNKLSTVTNAMRNMRIAINKIHKITIPNYMFTFGALKLIYILIYIV